MLEGSDGEQSFRKESIIVNREEYISVVVSESLDTKIFVYEWIEFKSHKQFIILVLRLGLISEGDIKRFEEELC
jgi:hypothetical protein